MHVLLSIKPEHVHSIFIGRKYFEFRRRVFAQRDVSTVVIYCTRPVRKIVGEFDIAAIICDSPNGLWKTTKGGSGISKEYFDKYFCGRDRAYAIQIGDVRVYSEPLDPNEISQHFTPPQSYKYIPTTYSEKGRKLQLEL